MATGKIKQWMDKMLETSVIFTSTLMMSIVALQILGRFILPWSPPWTEEAARYAFILMVSFGAGLALRDQAYVRVTFFLDWLPQAFRRSMEIFILICIVLISGIVAFYTLPLLNVVAIRKSSALNISMAWIYAGMLILGLFTAIYGLIALRKQINANQ